MKISSIGQVETKTSIGKTLIVNDKTIYPVIQTSTLSGGAEKTVFGVWISPVALVVVEGTGNYIISLTDRKFTLDQLLGTTPALKEKITPASRKRSKKSEKKVSGD
ncbi:MAG: hypothetical protein M1503_05190 [Thaumarchaeota archaeon]|nr:hypothetical protein [Nitrososphaerota archaeon]MCL5317645.1 hypothetical protein [Nitrososphaerota archaeon]